MRFFIGKCKNNWVTDRESAGVEDNTHIVIAKGCPARNRLFGK